LSTGREQLSKQPPSEFLLPAVLKKLSPTIKYT
jgi:hypothetical protein